MPREQATSDRLFPYLSKTIALAVRSYSISFSVINIFLTLFSEISRVAATAFRLPRRRYSLITSCAISDRHFFLLITLLPHKKQGKAFWASPPVFVGAFTFFQGFSYHFLFQPAPPKRGTTFGHIDLTKISIHSPLGETSYMFIIFQPTRHVNTSCKISPEAEASGL